MKKWLNMLFKHLFGRYVCVVVFLLGHLSTSKASHLVGGDIAVKWISGNNFEITLNYYRDCKNGQTSLATTVDVGLYELQTNTYEFPISLPLTSSSILSLGDKCNDVSNLICVERGVYKQTVTIPDNAKGYYLSHLICCRNNITSNILYSGNVGMVFYAEIPNPSLHKSTPVFGSYSNSFMCVNQPNFLDFSCIDPDGDSLVYSLVDPLEETASGAYFLITGGGGRIGTFPPPLPAPYLPINWRTPYSLANIIGGFPKMSIDSSSGLITANPVNATKGKVFVFSVRVEKYDKTTKKKLGEIRRDIQYIMLSCDIDLTPQFTSPSSAENSYPIFAGDSICFSVKLDDANTADAVFFSATSEVFNSTANGPTVTFTPKKGTKSIETIFCIQTHCDDIREAPYRITFNGHDSSCYGKNNITKTIDFYVYTIDGTLKDPIPNVFTPNGDGQNDTLKINTTINDCYDTFVIKIYDRWGDKVFESDSFAFNWDGKHYKSGKELNQGVYYYSLTGIFKDQTVERKGYLSLLK